MAPNKRNHRPVRAAGQLKKSVAAYCEVQGARLRADDRKVLNSLFADRVAAKVFAAFDADDRHATLLIEACHQARELARDFKPWAEYERMMPARMVKLDKAVVELRAFVEELAQGPRNVLAAPILHGRADWKAMRHGLSVISSDIAARRRIAHETLARIGAARKLADVSEAKAIGWLAKSIQRITGKPHTKHVAELATIVLELKESCSSVRVVKARKLLNSEWHLPLSKLADVRGKRF